jgi:aspartyl-tRNA(Asn)/glutamyl-tRNA(Gln) amidotransferase subunit B
MLNTPYNSVHELAQTLHIITQIDDNLTDQLIDDVLAKYPDKVKEYLYQGKKGVTGLFMGEIMRNSKGKLDAQTLTKRLTEKLINLKK